MFRATTAFNFTSFIWPVGSAILAILVFHPPQRYIMGTVLCNFPTFLHICIFFLLILLSSNFFVLSASYLRCFSFVYIVGSLISKVTMYKIPHLRVTLVVEISKKYIALQCEIHFEVKILKPPKFGPLLEIEISLRFITLHYT